MPIVDCKLNSDGAPALQSAWRRAGLLYLAFLLAGLAAGYWPQAIYPPADESHIARLPALNTIALAQAVFIFLVYPLMILEPATGNRQQGTGDRKRLLPVACCLLPVGVLMLASLPFYLAAGYVSDAAPTDVIRVAITVIALWPVALVAGRWMRRPGARAPVLILLLLAMLAAPAAVYLIREFLPACPSDWLWDVCPAGLAWQNAASRLDHWLPAPLWAVVFWPSLAAAGLLVEMILPKHRGPAATRA